MNNVYFIAGASGSGKSSIMSDLKKRLGDNVLVFDFDEIGVPQGADKRWRQKSTEEWLERLLKENKDACLLGQTVLGEILACPSAYKLGIVNFYFLDVSDLERIQRLKKRDTHGLDQHMLNWAAWLRVHHHDPQWMQHVIKDDCWDKLDFSVWDKLEKWDSKANVNYMNTTGLTISKVAELVCNWIKKREKARPG